MKKSNIVKAHEALQEQIIVLKKLFKDKNSQEFLNDISIEIYDISFLYNLNKTSKSKDKKNA